MRNLYFFILLMAVSLFSACSKDNIEHGNSFDKSYRNWQTFKKNAGNSYVYVVGSASWWGNSNTTTITVREGIVTGREYERKGYESDTSDTIVIKEQWTEDEQSLNTHGSGFEAWTLDRVYQEAKDNWLRKRSNAKFYFEAKNAGMISNCGYVENGCMDDCFIGVSIQSIKKL